MARISSQEFNQFLWDNLEIREKLIDTFVKDPFDEERDFVVSVLKEMVPYLRKMDESFLKQLYYRSNEYFFEINEAVFKWDEFADYFVIVTQGIVSIDITDGVNSGVLDLLGRGSVIGLHNALIDNETWNINCIARSS